ncbi:hypothetical protein A2609_01355 [Candidatus Kaiserbacteria bacterium RIFOXYD1_FULL_47_14]|uniref:Cytidyltransferase-like domain-containing protein n=1 Tax=Candidatus Kaiserbacteria bacterium RIFOXYD1_FULL_47_14 TaxID=1798533 RepID=A0A1F6G3N8_9BACT|nr:MAG: hypothetical protein A2609_01355 [Candidatus Kaiserbacteria bacterium RIFOXYD1_FULL_47_14]
MNTHPRIESGEVDPIFKSFHQKVVLDYEKLRKVVEGYQAVGRKVVVTIGSWDGGIHIGHARYIIRACAEGDILIVALDSDRAVKLYKGEYRPITPENERAELLTYLEQVSFVTCIDDVSDTGWWQCGLLEAVRPDIFVAVEDSYPEEQLAEIRQYVSKVVVLPRQAETSTSAVIGQIIKGHFLPAFQEVLYGTMERKTPVRPDSDIHPSNP